MSNHVGGPVALTDVMTPLATDEDDLYKGGVYHLTLRNNAGNDLCWFGNSVTNFTGFLEGGEAITFHNVNPVNIWVQGTTGQQAFWNGDGSN